jgi:hypothetical protein
VFAVFLNLVYVDALLVGPESGKLDKLNRLDSDKIVAHLSNQSNADVEILTGGTNPCSFCQ